MQQVTHYINTQENEVKTSLGTVKSETLSDRDAGFCSGEETDLDTEFHSPADTSRDSSDTKDSSLEFRINKNKRKSAEPRKVPDDVPPLKQIKLENDHVSSRIKLEPPFSPYENATDEKPSVSPFRPWNSDQRSRPTSVSCDHIPIPSGYVPPSSYIQEEPLSLVVEKKKDNDVSSTSSQLDETKSTYCVHEADVDVQDLRMNQPRPQEVVRIYESEDSQTYDKKSKPFTSADLQQHESNRFTSSSSTVSSEEKRKSSQSNNSQRNYKNMTRERRIEANARERTRVHTISAAFETLRKCVPAYANNQKLSKLSVLRIACSYIMTLSRIAGYDYSIDQSAPSIAECVDSVCSTIQMEGKTRKKKDE